MVIMSKVLESDDIEEMEESSEGASEPQSDNDSDTPAVENAGWADSIAKILKSNKPKRKRTIVLSKAKKLTEVKTKKTKTGFEVETAAGEIKEEEIEVEEKETVPEPRTKRKRELPSCRVKPNILERDKERLLTKIATRGVVQLFNAVKMQQKDITKKLNEAGPLEVHKEKVLKNIDKRAFMDVLMGGKTSQERVKDQEKVKEESTWSVLRDDFMMGAKLKDWDKELEQEEEEKNQELEIESD